MKRAVLFVVSLYCYLSSTAQFYDRNWLLGSGIIVNISFNNNNIDTSSFSRNPIVDFRGAAANISDTNGNVLFYYNGVNIGNRLSQILDGGAILPDSLFAAYFQNGFTEHQTCMILPKSDNLFYLFYYSVSDSLFNTHTIAMPDRLYYAIIDMSQSGGLGKVISKKNIAYKGLFGDCRLTACRHANGRDWWLVHQGFMTNEYFVYRVSPDSVYPPQIQHIGPCSFLNENLASQSAFSPDGSKFATVCLEGPLVLMDFDRCSGTFSQPDSIFVPIDTIWYGNNQISTSTNGGTGVCFSENSNLLYLCNGNGIIQYDTRVPNVAGTYTMVGRYDTTGLRSNFPSLYQMYLLPNGKVIVDKFNGGYEGFSLIDNPDIAGSGCHFNFNGLHTSTPNSIVLPNMINYRLSRLLGSTCDTLTGVDEVKNQNAKVKVYPNPAIDKLTVSLVNYHRDARLEIYDAFGRVAYKNESMYLDDEVDIGAFSSGIYLVRIFSPDSDATAKFVKE